MSAAITPVVREPVDLFRNGHIRVHFYSFSRQGVQFCNKTRHFFEYVENDEGRYRIPARFDELNLSSLFDLKLNMNRLVKKYLNF